MAKENVYIVLFHKHVLTTPGKKGDKPIWSLSEKVEFVSKLRNKHLTMSSAVGDYINRKMESDSRIKFNGYNNFEKYIRSKFPKEMEQLDNAYDADRIKDTAPILVTDQFGQTREQTIFDK